MKKPFLLSLLVTALIAQVVHSQEKWTAEKVMKYNHITETNISPDGQYIAYVVRKPLMEGEKSEYNSQIWITVVDGSFNVQYTRGDKSSTSPRFSPDGKKIAFLSNRINDKSQIFLMRLMGGEPEQITDSKTGVTSIKWSPDGSKIAYLMKDPDTEEEEKLKKEKRDVILVDQNFKYNRIYTVSINLNELGKRDIKQLISGAYHVNDFNWSPDGSTIVFSYRPDPGLNWTFLESDISIIPSDSGKVIPIITQPGLDFNPIYSPDGKWIAFQSNGGKPEPVGVSDLYKVQARGGNILELKKSPDRRAQIISWSQDGSHLFITETYKTSQTLFALPSDNNGKALQGDFVAYSDSKLAILTSLQGTSRSFSISQSGNRMSYTYQDTDKPVEVFIADLKGANSRKISSVNDDFNPPRMGKTELISWNSTDGTAIEGLLTYPAEFKKGEKYPIVLQIHGGPFGVFRKNYTGEPSIYMTQYFAQNGFIILRPNPRGSSGYGKKFRFANVNDWGFGDYEDLISGVDHVLSMGIADSDQQFVMGWSYGGYMTSWVVTQTDRFKAASMGAGLPNLISMVTTTDIPDFIVAHMGGQEFWEDYKEYERHSAIYQIAKVKTPTQVIHGANDLRVPFAQGMEFYNALKRKGVDTEMVVYPRTPHGPTEPKFLMDVSPRILAWFEKYMD